MSPCAIATVLLFASWTALRCPRLGSALRTFAVFGAGVVGVYSLAGLGFYAVLARSLASPALRVLGQSITALAVMVVAVVLLEDANRARLGCTRDLLVGVGSGSKDLSRRALRWAGRSGLRFGSVVAAGAIVGGLELTCTGVVYLPMLAYLASSGASPACVGTALAVHNLAFLTPLAIATAAGWVASRRATEVLASPSAVARFRVATALALLALGTWMVAQVSGVAGL